MAALRSPHEPVTDHEGEPSAGIAAVKILLDHLLDDRPEKAALIRFAPEDCKACTPARNDSHTPSGTCRNDGRVSGKGPSAPDGEGDKFLAHRKGLFKKRAGSRPGTIRRLGGGLVNEQLRPGSRRRRAVGGRSPRNKNGRTAQSGHPPIRSKSWLG